jgi:hypothetical protein
VLEPEGICGVKFRKNDVIKVMRRLDEDLQAMEQKVETLKKTNEKFNQPEIEKLQEEIAARENKLFPLYHQSAAKFADLHDTPGRMLAKGVLTSQVPWEGSRRFFSVRLRRRLREVEMVDRVLSAMSNSHSLFAVSDTANEDGKWEEARELLKMWCSEEGLEFEGKSNDWQAVHAVDVAFVASNYHKSDAFAARLNDLSQTLLKRRLASQDDDELTGALCQMLQSVSPAVLAAVQSRMKA